jgi:hypothetical protein
VTNATSAIASGADDEGMHTANAKLCSGAEVRSTLAYAALRAALRARGIAEGDVEVAALQAYQELMQAARHDDARGVASLSGN